MPKAKRKTFYEKLSPHEKRYVNQDYMRISKKARATLISDIYKGKVKIE